MNIRRLAMIAALACAPVFGFAPATIAQDNTMTTDSGLKITTHQEGTGAQPQPGDTVSVHYTGWLQQQGEKGTKFDSSVDRGEPLRFRVGVGQVIKGWDEGLLQMKEGGKATLTIPPQLGYGASGAGGVIPPHAVLIFDVELLEIAK